MVSREYYSVGVCVTRFPYAERTRPIGRRGRRVRRRRKQLHYWDSEYRNIGDNNYLITDKMIKFDMRICLWNVCWTDEPIFLFFCFKGNSRV